MSLHHRELREPSIIGCIRVLTCTTTNHHRHVQQKGSLMGGGQRSSSPISASSQRWLTDEMRPQSECVGCLLPSPSPPLLWPGMQLDHSPQDCPFLSSPSRDHSRSWKTVSISSLATRSGGVKAAFNLARRKEDRLHGGRVFLGIPFHLTAPLHGLRWSALSNVLLFPPPSVPPSGLTILNRCSKCEIFGGEDVALRECITG